MQARERALSWEGCLNVRDLGGHATGDGATTRFDSVVRADSVRRLSDDGWRALVEYGIRTIVDLRYDDELEADPPPDVPAALVHIPLLGERDDAYWARVDALAAASDDPTATVYLEMLERYRENFGAAVREVADAPPGGVVVHCQGGKDRTGLVVALLLRLVGVGIEDIASDYAASGENLRERHEEWIALAEDEEERRRRQRIVRTLAASMVTVLNELERRYGSVEEYLRAAGLDDGTITRARTRLVAPSPVPLATAR